MDRTEPKLRFPKGFEPNPSTLAAGRYGTREMVRIWGPDQTFSYSLKAQGQAALTLASLYPDIVPLELAEEINRAASLTYIAPDRIRELEAKKGHDVIAINTALEEVVSREAGAHINKGRTSGDTTQTARAMQLKESLEVIADSVENLRDIIIEKSILWIDKPHMDCTHGYDALPSVAGRAFAHYAEMLGSGLKFLKFVYDNSIVGKWADATGNHHSAVALGIDGIRLQERYCKDLGIGFMTAQAQIPGLEFEADIVFVMARLGETMNNIARYVAWGRSDDVNIFINASPTKQKASAAMPHKDAKNGNPDTEEQVASFRNYIAGNLTTAMMNCELPYARTLYASANGRINSEDSFKFMDHVTRRLANTAFWIDLSEDRSVERVLRSYGVVTSQCVMTYLTDPRKVENPLTRSEAHDLMGHLATEAWNSRTNFIDVLLKNNQVTSRLDEATLRDISDPLKYIGQSKEIIQDVANEHYKDKTLV
jgi:adenylosuccinate lyase